MSVNQHDCGNCKQTMSSQELTLRQAVRQDNRAIVQQLLEQQHAEVYGTVIELQCKCTSTIVLHIAHLSTLVVTSLRC